MQMIQVRLGKSEKFIEIFGALLIVYEEMNISDMRSEKAWLNKKKCTFPSLFFRFNMRKSSKEDRQL